MHFCLQCHDSGLLFSNDCNQFSNNLLMFPDVHHHLLHFARRTKKIQLMCYIGIGAFVQQFAGRIFFWELLEKHSSC